MAAPPWMPLYVAQYLADTPHLAPAEHGVYLLLLMHQWQCGSIPADHKKLARITRCPSRQWPAVWRVVGSYFVPLNGDSLVNRRLAAERLKSGEISSKRKDAALQMHSRRKANASDVQADLQTQRQKQRHPQIQDSAGAYAPGSLVGEPPDGDAPAQADERSGWPADYREQFQRAYPHKVAMAAALPVLDAIRRAGRVGWDALIEAVRAYAAKTDDRPWANPITWLKQERWNDRPAPEPARNERRVRPGLADVAAELIAEARDRERSAGDDGGEIDRD